MSEVTEQPAAPESTAAAPAEQAPEKDLSLFGNTTEVIEPEVESEPETVLKAEVEQQLLEDEAEEDLGGLKVRGKKEEIERLKNERLMQADYTRKTQELAETRRAEEARYAEYQRTAQMREAMFVENARILANNDRLEQFRRLDWDAITKADPVQAMTLERQMRNLESENQQIAQSIAFKQQQMTLGEQRENARRIEEGRQQLAREIKGWSPELQAKLASTATKEYGFKPEELAQVSDPRTVKLLHDAHMYRELMAKQATKPAPAPLPKPVTKVGGGSATNRKAPSDMSASEYASWRQERRSRR